MIFRTVAYTNHTVLPEALEKWSYDLMQRLLPRHVEIIEMIDEQVVKYECIKKNKSLLSIVSHWVTTVCLVYIFQLIGDIISEYGTSSPEILRKKLVAMRVIENFDLPPSIVELFAKQEESLIAETVDEVKSSENDVSEEKETPKKKKAVKKEPVSIPPKIVRMANLCVVGGHAVNGVAEIHSEIVKEEVFNDFFKVNISPEFYLSLY